MITDEECNREWKDLRNIVWYFIIFNFEYLFGLPQIMCKWKNLKENSHHKFLPSFLVKLTEITK
jgi:hypothetical protein